MSLSAVNRKVCVRRKIIESSCEECLVCGSFLFDASHTDLALFSQFALIFYSVEWSLVMHKLCWEDQKHF